MTANVQRYNDKLTRGGALNWMTSIPSLKLFYIQDIDVVVSCARYSMVYKEFMNSFHENSVHLVLFKI